MKYHRLYIDTDGTREMFDRITDLLHLQPTVIEGDTSDDNVFGIWMYCVDTDDQEPHFDFINVFLDITDQYMDGLKLLGIAKSDITIWLVYEYDQQCSMEFHPEEMTRIGKSGITLCIDCFQRSLNTD